MTKYSITNTKTTRFLGVYRATCAHNAIAAASRAVGSHLFGIDLDVVPTLEPVQGPEDCGAWERRTSHLREAARGESR